MKNILHQSLTVKVGSETREVGASSIICPVCKKGNTNDPVVYGFENISIVRCSNCNTMHLYPMPDEESLFAIYNNNYYKDAEQIHGYFDYASEESSIKKTYARRIQAVQRKLGDEMLSLSTFHEIGCALGIGLSEIREQIGKNVSGSDISLDAEKACKEKEIPFSLSNAKGIHSLDHGKKDMVFVFDVIEHLSDIPAFTTFLDDLISDAGYLVVTTPNMKALINKILGSRSPSIKIPQHTIYFDTDTLSAALNDKFELVSVVRDYQFTPISRLIERVLHIFKLNCNLFKNITSEVLVPNGMSVYIFKKRGK
ncbi:MAG: methyltransferase domain-containing protein [Methylococcaceae bacterium]|nr:methyltransferase domain-containing protein [Methylococcaceae bacterium]